MTVLLWSPAYPNRCACDNAYQPVLNAKGELVKSKDPAWKMMEQTRDTGCLQEHFRLLGEIYLNGRYQHHKISKGSGAGYPDVHVWTPLRDDGGGSAYIELKKMGCDPTGDQVRVMAELQDAGHLVYLARPCCLLTGAADELMAAFAGRTCLYVRDAGRAFTPVQIPDGAPIPARPARHAPARPHAEPTADGGRRPLYRQPDPPGAVPQPFTPAVGVTVPQPGTPQARDAMHQLEDWLRTAGFSPGDVPYPIRLVTLGLNLHVHCRVGLARPGSDVRVWRQGTPACPFPDELIDRLAAYVIFGPSSGRVAEQVAAALATT